VCQRLRCRANDLEYLDAQRRGPPPYPGRPTASPPPYPGRPTASPPPYPGRPTAGADRALRAFPTSVVAGDRYFKSYIAAQVETHGADNVSVYGDSAGGTLAMLAVQKIVRDCGNDAECLETSVPTRTVLLSPSLGGTTIYDDPNVVLVDEPVTSIPKPGDPPDWQGDTTDDRLWNPMAGSAARLPPTLIYLGTRDILTLGALLFSKRMDDASGDVTLIIGKGQITTVRWVAPRPTRRRPSGVTISIGS
jgi:alpha/beta hydrolase fold